jgi:CheY-like chemotaxis protein
MALLAEGRPVPIISTFRLETASGARVGEPAEYLPPRRPRVLLVDDSRVTREMLRRILLDAGFEVVAVASVGGAVDSLSQTRFDCVVTDIEMPGKDGLELTRHIRSRTESAQMPIIVVSTRNRAEDRLAGLEAGADVYLTKQNLDADELVTAIRRFGSGDEP